MARSAESTLRAALRKDQRTANTATFEHRHFAEIARVITTATDHGFGVLHRRAMADMFAAELAKTNSRFDRARFLAACGYTD